MENIKSIAQQKQEIEDALKFLDPDSPAAIELRRRYRNLENTPLKN